MSSQDPFYLIQADVSSQVLSYQWLTDVLMSTYRSCIDAEYVCSIATCRRSSIVSTRSLQPTPTGRTWPGKLMQTVIPSSSRCVMHGHACGSPARPGIFHSVDPFTMQLDMLAEAVDTAAENPARFNLTIEEIGSRRKWLDTTRRQGRHQAGG